MKQANVTRNYKDTLFRMVFREKKELLSLYNAINGTNYDDPEALTITTIEDAIYMGMKNDVSFILKDVMNLYEGQASWNPNMPLRGLFYISSLYQGYIAEHHLNIYSSTQLKLPKPKYIVFYNGTRDEPDRQELRLSASFAEEGGAPCIECVALVLNINYGRNRKLMEACKKLHDYSYFVASVREFLQEGLALAEAVDCAVQHCIRENVLKEFLEIHRVEVKEMILSEYYEDFHRQMMCEEARAQGLADGTAQGIAKGRAQGIAEGKAQGIAEGKAQGIAEGKAQGIAEGKAQGIAEGKAQGIAEGTQAFRHSLLQCIEQKWRLSEDLRSKIQAQDSLETLQRWLSLAWESASIQELEEKIARL